MAPETFTDALIECVKAAGGSKAVATVLWGSSAGVDVAQRRLLSCLNPERPEKLSLDEALQIMRLARGRGCHTAMQFLAGALSYAEPVPIEPKDEADELRRRVLEMGRELQSVLTRLEQVERPATSRGAA